MKTCGIGCRFGCILRLRVVEVRLPCLFWANDLILSEELESHELPFFFFFCFSQTSKNFAVYFIKQFSKAGLKRY